MTFSPMMININMGVAGVRRYVKAKLPYPLESTQKFLKHCRFPQKLQFIYRKFKMWSFFGQSIYADRFYVPVCIKAIFLN